MIKNMEKEINVSPYKIDRDLLAKDPDFAIHTLPGDLSLKGAKNEQLHNTLPKRKHKEKA